MQTFNSEVWKGVSPKGFKIRRIDQVNIIVIDVDKIEPGDSSDEDNSSSEVVSGTADAQDAVFRHLVEQGSLRRR